jgi:hypothetical protein
MVLRPSGSGTAVGVRPLTTYRTPTRPSALKRAPPPHRQVQHCPGLRQPVPLPRPITLLYRRRRCDVSNRCFIDNLHECATPGWADPDLVTINNKWTWPSESRRGYKHDIKPMTKPAKQYGLPVSFRYHNRRDATQTPFWLTQRKWPKSFPIWWDAMKKAA